MKTALTIAGSDSSGGAGIQADLKTFEAHGLFGMSVITSVTAQNTLGVRGVWDIPPEAVREQIRAVFEDLPVHGVKIGMLSNLGIISAVADMLERYGEDLPIVLDPVMIATSGDRLLAEDAVEGLKERLLPLATIVTPNVKEAEAITGRPVTLQNGIEDHARLIYDMGAQGVLITGGDNANDDEITDLLFDGNEAVWLTSRRIVTRHTHGTGCTLSSAIAAGLVMGSEVEEAVKQAREYVYRAIVEAPGLGNGHGPLRHRPVRESGVIDN